VGHGVAVLDLDLSAILGPRAQKSTDHALLVCRSPRGMVEDAEESLGLDGNGARRSGGGGLGDLGGSQRASQVEVRGGAHLRECVSVWPSVRVGALRAVYTCVGGGEG
jgi:hypothetical protein